MRPRFKNRFLVIRRLKSAVYVKPLCDVYVKQFLHQRTRGEEVEPTFPYKVDVSEVKLLTNIHLVTSNQRGKFYENFMTSHEVPEAMYFNQCGPDAFEGTLRTWDQVMDTQDDNEVMDELQAADQIINFTRKSQVQSKLALQRPYKTELRKCFGIYNAIVIHYIKLYIMCQLRKRSLFRMTSLYIV